MNRADWERKHSKTHGGRRRYRIVSVSLWDDHVAYVDLLVDHFRAHGHAAFTSRSAILRAAVMMLKRETEGRTAAAVLRVLDGNQASSR